MVPERKCPPAVLRLTHSGLKVRVQPFRVFFAFFRLLFVVETIFLTNTQDKPNILLATAQTATAGDGRRSPFVV